ncbi:hypothetical protein HDV06_001397 [Boothiomyces sp. JEL0866]|nr:hypothetical protein HDV06_001397 [Boothiomyces sp. JEL0866]
MRDRPASPTKKQKRFLAVPTFITPQELYQYIKDPAHVAGRDYLVVDVRDSDFAGGNIIGCRNIPAHHFNDEMEINTVHDELKAVGKLFFHCALSQVRGPRCAQKYCTFINQSSGHFEQEIVILRGGFEEFKSLYSQDKSVVENISFGY